VRGSSRNWRQRSAAPRFSQWWKPWYSLRFGVGRGRTINERPSVGLKDLVAAPTDVAARVDVRWRNIGMVSVVLLVVLFGRLTWLQTVEYKSSVASVRNNTLRTADIPATRGQILDRNGEVLVGNQTTTELCVPRVELTLNPSVIGALAVLTGMSTQSIHTKLMDQRFLPYQPIPIMVNTPANLIEYLSLHSAEFPGVTLIKVSTRVYPLGGSTAPHVLGYTGPITGDELAQHPNAGYQLTSSYGQAGIESFYEPFLRGVDGQQTERVDRAGNVLGTIKVTQPVVGNSVVLNLDGGLQQAVQGYLAEAIGRARRQVDPRSGRYPPAPNGAAIVLDPNNGHVLAMTSFPTYNLQNFVGGLSDAQFQTLLHNGAFNDYAIQGLYTPGSTFKMVSATAQLAHGLFPPYQYVNDTGTYKVPGCLQGYHGCLFHDDETAGNGMVDLPMALTKSSDYYFYNIGYLFWSHTGRYGTTPIQDIAHQYGLDSLSLIDLPFESVGRVDSPTVRERLHAANPKAFPNYSWYTGDNLEMAFGQGSTAVTPLGLATAYATFANGGTRYAPEVAAAVVGPTGKVLRLYQPRVLNRLALTPAITTPITQGLLGVVNSPSGTAYWSFRQYFHGSLAAFPIAGKTGTASNQPGQEPNSWFVGFGPVGHPRYVVLCVVGEGGYGASVAAPVVAQTFNYLVGHPIGTLHFNPVVATSGGAK
jgi:penicillin-binding protein 2